MKNREVIELANELKVARHLGDKRLKLALLINEEEIENRAVKVSSLLMFPDRYKEFQNKLKDMSMEHAEKDNDGNPILYQGIGGTGKVITDPNERGYWNLIVDPEVYRERLEALTAEYQDAIDEFNSNNIEYESLLNEEAADLNIIKFSSDLLPDDISYESLKKLSPLLK